MSRRVDRVSDLKRHRSRFDREPSPKRSRSQRDGKLATESSHGGPESNKNTLDRDQSRRRFQDVVPLESASRQNSKVEIASAGKESETKGNGNESASKVSADVSKEPLSRSYFEHDDRASTRKNERSSGRRTDGDRWWRNFKEYNDKGEIKTNRRDEKTTDNREDSSIWRHDGYFEMEKSQRETTRKRPAFSEQKVSAMNPEKPNKIEVDPMSLNHPLDHPFKSGRDERVYDTRHYDKNDRRFARERESNRDGVLRGNFSSRDRYGASTRVRGSRDQFNPRQSYRVTGGHVEKWKHDLYNEANRSPTPKNDEDQVSKIEALLAS